MLTDSDLYLLVKRRFRGEGDLDSLYKFIAYVKWGNKNYYCKSKKCSSGNSKNKEFKVPKNPHKYPAYSKICSVCKNMETPTSNTLLHGINYLPALIETVYIIIKVQWNENRRLNTKEIFKILVSHGNRITESTIEKYRVLIQNLFFDWGLGYQKSRKIYGVEKFCMGQGKTKKWIYVLSQLSSPRQIFAKVYSGDNYSSLYNFLPGEFIKNSEKIILYDWGKEYPTLKDKYHQLNFTNEHLELRHSVTEISVALKEWLKNQQLYNSKLVDLHIRECISVLFQNYTPIQIIKYMISVDLTNLKI